MNDPAEIMIAQRGVLHSQTIAALSALKSQFVSIRSDNALMKTLPATKIVLACMGDYFRRLKDFDDLAGREKSPSAADELTFVISATTNAFLSAAGLPAIVASERTVRTKPRAIRPDISVWNHEQELIAFVECKTNLGWNRNNWREQYWERTEKVRNIIVGVDSYLCILTAENWPSDIYRKDDMRRKRWFCLAEPWPTELVAPFDHQILDPIEPMLIEIRNRFQALAEE